MKFETLRNGVANLAAGFLPILVIVFTTPYVVNTLGAEHYGLLTLITAIIGYFALIDLNFTAGSLKYASEYHASGNARRRDQTLTASFLLYLAIGAVGALMILGSADWLVTAVFKVPDADHALAASALRLAALGFLLGQVQSYLHTVPQALRRYDQSALLESFFGVTAPLINVLVLWWGGGLYEIVLARVVLSALNLIALGAVIRRLLPDGRLLWPTRDVVAPLASFSAFAYLNRLASLAYAQGDKLIIGAVVGMSALTYYAVPFMLANRIYGLSYRLGSVILPAASSLAALQRHDAMRELYLYSARYVFFINCVLTLLLSSFAYEILHYWIGAEMASVGSLILVLIALGNLIDSLTNAPSLVNDALGKPKITGVFSITRAALGLTAVFVFVQSYGVLGAAIAQLMVSLVMPAIFLVYVHGRSVPVSLRDFLRVAAGPSLPVVVLAAVIPILRTNAGPLGLPQALGLGALESVVVALYGWFVVVRPTDRDAFFRRLKATCFAGGST